PEQAAKDMDRLFEVFQAHNIRYFFYIGGNDSQDTAHKIHEQGIARGFEMRVNGVPKTIDNDLPETDHCPGYGSVIKYNGATVMEVAIDVEAMATDGGSCCLVEVMGRSAGWIAAGTVLARRSADDAPHIILVPEIALNEEHLILRDWFTEDGFLPNEKFVEYARPLIEGEIKYPIENGLPKFVTLEKVRVEKKLPARV